MEERGEEMEQSKKNDSEENGENVQAVGLRESNGDGEKGEVGGEKGELGEMEELGSEIGELEERVENVKAEQNCDGNEGRKSEGIVSDEENISSGFGGRTLLKEDGAGDNKEEDAQCTSLARDTVSLASLASMARDTAVCGLVEQTEVPDLPDQQASGSVVHPYALPLTLSPMEGPASPALTPINAQLDSEASSVSSDRDSAFPLDPEGSPLYFESGYSEEGRRVYSEREAEFLVAPVLDSEADSGTGSVCEEEADDAQDQEEKSSASRKLIQPDLLAMSQLLNFDEEDEASDSEEEVPEVATATEVKREEGGTLNLTLDEVRHIRTALTRAELEGLPPSVSQGRLCFSCMSSKFGLFWRGHPCNLCSMLICGKCVNKVWLPPETFSATPVLALSPLPPSSPSPAPPISLPPSHLDCSLPGTAPTSPTIERRKSPPSLPYISTVSAAVSPSPLSPCSLQPLPGKRRCNNKYNTLPRRRWSSVATPLAAQEGRQLDLCQDCRGMVSQVTPGWSSPQKEPQSSVFFANLSRGTPTEQRY